MKKLWIPLYNHVYSEDKRAKLLRELARVKPDVILMTVGRILRNPGMRDSEIAMFSENVRFLREAGYTVGAWLAPTIGYGGPFYGDNDAVTEYTHVKRVGSGEDLIASYCPLDERFAEDYTATLTALARTGVKIILLEDDYALGCGKFLHDSVCACPRHMKKYAERLGRPITREELAPYIIDGGRNRYREIFLDLMGDTMRDFTRATAQAVHAVDPEIRIGISANHATYIDEGTNTPELAHIAAGNTRPLVRMTGAPYWKQDLTLAPNIETERMQSVWCGEDIERITEGDTYPRPRHWVPSAHLEAFDMILKADGNNEGILKYVIDYNSSADYETGYVDRHLKNQPHYEEIERRFGGMRNVGLRVFENMDLYVDRVFDRDVPITAVGRRHFLPTVSQWFTSDNSIPTTYDAEDCPMLVFGENAQYLTHEQMTRGVILDGMAAKRLFDRGVDIGITSVKRECLPSAEKFFAQGEMTLAMSPADGVFYGMTLKAGAIADSDFIVGTEGLGVIQAQGIEDCRRYPACFRYENADGEKFMVYSFVAETVTTTDEWVPGLFRNYCRQRQIADGYEWLGGKKLPAMCYKNPELYVLAKKSADGAEMSVGMWNLFADEVLSPVIELDSVYRDVTFYNCSGHMEGNKVFLDRDLGAYGLAFFTVYQ